MRQLFISSAAILNVRSKYTNILLPCPAEVAHSEVEEHQRYDCSQPDLRGADLASLVCDVFAVSSSAGDYSDAQEQESSDFVPELADDLGDAFSEGLKT